LRLPLLPFVGGASLSASGDQGSVAAALREENHLLRTEQLREKKERQKLRNYTRAHSPHFGAPVGGPTSVVAGPSSALGTAGGSAVEAVNAPLPPSPRLITGDGGDGGGGREGSLPSGCRGGRGSISPPLL